jgi:hypothetical protein
LDLSWNDTGNDTTIGLHLPPTLRHLDLSFSSLNDARCLPLLATLSQSSCVAVLDLSGNQIGWPTAVEIARYVRDDSRLERLSLSNNVNLTVGGCLSILLVGVALNIGGRLVRVQMEGCHSVCASSSRMPEEPLVM